MSHPQTTRPLAVLIGPPLAGKTTIAAQLAKRTGTTVLDADAAIVERAGKPIPGIFADDGEPAFRALEAEVIADSLTSHDGILALGGGAVITPATRKRLSDYARGGGTVVLLDLTAAEAARRFSTQGVAGRPLLADGENAALDNWRRLKRQRQDWYDELATLTIDTGRNWPGQIVNMISAKLMEKNNDPRSSL